MDLHKFQKDAIKTESVIDAVNVNINYLAAVLQIMISAGNLLDQLKKNIYYDKPIDHTDRAKHLSAIIEAMDTKHLFVDNPLENTTILKTNSRVFHAVVGIATESTELLENIVDPAGIDTVNLLEECGDIGWYMSILIDETGGNWDQTLTATIEKLKSRYPDKFNNTNANTRDLTTERAILDSELTTT